MDSGSSGFKHMIEEHAPSIPLRIEHESVEFEFGWMNRFDVYKICALEKLEEAYIAANFVGTMKEIFTFASTFTIGDLADMIIDATKKNDRFVFKRSSWFTVGGIALLTLSPDIVVENVPVLCWDNKMTAINHLLRILNRELDRHTRYKDSTSSFSIPPS